jgi:hypothetical protein
MLVKGAAGASQRSTAHHRARGSATVKPARYRGSPTHATATRAHTRGGEDLDSGVRLHSSSSRGGGFPCQPRGGQAKAIAAKPLSAPPLLTVDEMDKMYRQLVEIHSISTTQLAECAHWCWSDSTPSSVWAGTDRSRPVVTPSTITLAPSPPTDFLSHAPLWRQDQHGEPHAHRQACQGSVGTLPECRA